MSSVDAYMIGRCRVSAILQQGRLEASQSIRERVKDNTRMSEQEDWIREDAREQLDKEGKR